MRHQADTHKTDNKIHHLHAANRLARRPWHVPVRSERQSGHRHRPESWHWTLHCAPARINRRPSDCLQPPGCMRTSGRGDPRCGRPDHGDRRQHLRQSTVQNPGRPSAQPRGPIDILVCNAATHPCCGPATGMRDEVVEKIMRNNVLSSSCLCNLVYQDMRAKRDGAIPSFETKKPASAGFLLGAGEISRSSWRRSPNSPTCRGKSQRTWGAGCGNRCSRRVPTRPLSAGLCRRWSAGCRQRPC